MNLVIKNIILYPKNKSKKPRRVEFSENKVNIIRGNSHRGKSAIIDIIDYCLGSKDCSIPINKIRDYTSVFAIHVKTNNSEIFLARKNPEENDSTEIVFLHEEDKINVESLLNNKILERLEKIKGNRREVISRLNDLSGFSNMRFDNDDSVNNWNDAISFRDTTAFQFQPQTIVANPTTLFFKTDTYKHQNRLRTIFPLILGYKTYEMILLEKEIELLNKEIDDLKKELNNEIIAYEKWKKSAYDYYLEAIKLGLSNREIKIDESNVNDIVSELNRIVNSSSKGNVQIEGASKNFSSRLEKLNQERALKTRELDDFKFSLSKISEINNSKNDYKNEVVQVKKDRLKPIEWFFNNKSDEKCPFCDSISEKASLQLTLLKNEAEKNDRIHSAFTSNEINLDKQIIKLKNKIKILEKEVIAVDSKLNLLVQENKSKNVTFDSIYKFIGRLEQVIINIKNTTPNSSLNVSIDKLNNTLDDKLGELKNISQDLNQEQSISLLADKIFKYTQLLDIEDGDKNRVLLDVESLNIKIKDNKRDKPYYLSRVGSGANHMGYHIATLLGLHEYFLNLPKKKRPNYIPSFIVIDQPSQVYYPDKIPQNLDNLDIADIEKEEELNNTRKIFKACSEFIKNTNGKVQVIILEHAPKITWKGLKEIHLVEEWMTDDKRNNNALIPRDWLIE